MKSREEDASCPFCGTKKATVRYPFDSSDILRCSNCELMWLHPLADADKLHEIYDENYYSNRKFTSGSEDYIYGYADYMAERLHKQYGYKKNVSALKQMLPDSMFSAKERPEWLDIGCGLGLLMDVAFDEGFNVHGIEFNPFAVEHIRSKYNFEVSSGMLSDVVLKRKYDVISMFDVIEHLMNPFEDLERLRQSIKSTGYILIQTMDSDSLVSRLLGKRLEDFRRIREHFFFFSRRSLTRILDELGWEVCSIESSGHTFQISFLIDRIRIISPTIAMLLRYVLFPRVIRDANVYINPGTKMLVCARPK